MSFTALKFHETLLGQTAELVEIPQVAELRRKLVPTLAESHVIAGRFYHLVEPNQQKMREHLQKALELDPRSHMALVFKSIVDLTCDHNPQRALEAIQLSHGSAGKNGTWRYNEGFLLMYLERFRDALPIYRAIARQTFEDEELTLDEVITFNLKALENEPSRIQSMFILGFLYYKKKGNLPLALEHFERFIKKARNQPKYNILLKEAGKYLKQIRGAMARNQD